MKILEKIIGYFAKIFFTWIFKDAKWYQFWLLQSGPIGGFINALIFILSFKLFF